MQQGATVKRRRAQPHVTLDELMERRRLVGLSQARLAMMAGMQPTVLCDIMHGRKSFTALSAKRLDAVLSAFERALQEVRKETSA